MFTVIKKHKAKQMLPQVPLDQLLKVNTANWKAAAAGGVRCPTSMSGSGSGHDMCVL